jgi:predicted glycoside hydrolase/deacetylase ChbG (UPF0249 family)
MIRLVVNAEEFGGSAAGDLDIARAHRDGVVTSTSLLGNCSDFARARRSLADMPKLGVGISLALIGGTPIESAPIVSTLVNASGTLRSTPAAFAIDWLKNAVAPADVEREMEAQVTRARDAGLVIDHVCTRGHLGFLPGVGQIVERIARRHKIAGIRTSVEPPTLSWLADPRRGLETGVLAGLSWLTRRRLGALRNGPRTWGYLESDRLDEVRILEIIGRLGPGSHELICHPHDSTPDRGASAEMRALTSMKVKNALERRAIVLCRWQDLF